MSESNIFRIGDDVKANDGIRGIVMDIHKMSGGLIAVGIMRTNGRIEYHLDSAVRSAEGMIGYPMHIDF